MASDFFENVAASIGGSFEVELADSAEAIRPEFFESSRGVRSDSLLLLVDILVRERAVEETGMIVRPERLIPIFTAMKVADILGEVTAQPFDEVAEVMIVERVVGRDIVSLSKLGSGAVLGVSVSKGNERITAAIFVHCRFVNDPHCPHKISVDTTTETLTTSHFHRADSIGGPFEDESPISCFESFKR